jgi:hypothetical protein
MMFGSLYAPRDLHCMVCYSLKLTRSNVVFEQLRPGYPELIEFR